MFCSAGSTKGILGIFFSLHEIIDDLDSLIESMGADSISNRKLFKKIESGIERRRSLVRGS